MARIFMICGKICSGKTTYSNKLKNKINAVVLSCDDLMLTLFDEQLGDKHGEIVEKSTSYLYNLAQDIIDTNTNVILDFGFWSKVNRINTINFFKLKKIETELHYVKVNKKIWISQMKNRNLLVKEGKVNCYTIDDNLKEKAEQLFEEPGKDEDYILVNQWQK